MLHAKTYTAIPCPSWWKEADYKDVVSALLMPDGLNYGYLPKDCCFFINTPKGIAHRWRASYRRIVLCDEQR
jgi:hypothetical protein